MERRLGPRTQLGALDAVLVSALHPPSFSSSAGALITPVRSRNFGLDRAFSGLLSRENEEKSVEAGRQLLLMKSLKADRTLDRIQRAVAAGTAPGHFATLFAVRAAVFSIAPRTTVSAYLLQELVCEIPDSDHQAELLALGLSEVNDFFRHSVETKSEGMRSNA